ncbi:MAG: hypothetical protein MH252_03355 [Thermosynechococcaceae cyanobacterium MS004]|nr:hypothetical protein [Thermosynechococcaceae cyanobacterium MS004]
MSDRLSGSPHADSCACFHVAAPKRDRLLHCIAKVGRSLAVLSDRAAHAGRSWLGLCCGWGVGAIAGLWLDGCWRVRGKRLARAELVLCGRGDRIALDWRKGAMVRLLKLWGRGLSGSGGAVWRGA